MPSALSAPQAITVPLCQIRLSSVPREPMPSLALSHAGHVILATIAPPLSTLPSPAQLAHTLSQMPHPVKRVQQVSPVCLQICRQSLAWEATTVWEGIPPAHSVLLGSNVLKYMSYLYHAAQVTILTDTLYCLYHYHHP